MPVINGTKKNVYSYPVIATNTMPKLHGTTFILRPWRLDDTDSLALHANNSKIAMNLRDGFPNPYLRADAVKWIKMVLENKKDLILAVDIGGEAVGGIGLHGKEDVYRFNAEIGYWLSEKYWGRGIMSEAVRLLVDYGFENYSWTRIYAGVFSNNEGSMRVLINNDFTEEAVLRKSVKKNGNYLDEHIFSLRKENWKGKQWDHQRIAR